MVFGGNKGWHCLDGNSIKDKKKYHHLINIIKCNNKEKNKQFLVSIVMMWKSHRRKKMKTMKLFKFCLKLTFDHSKLFI